MVVCFRIKKKKMFVNCNRFLLIHKLKIEKSKNHNKNVSSLKKYKKKLKKKELSMSRI